MASIDIIYCAAGNDRFHDIAGRYGFLHGSQLPRKPYMPLHFSDHDWKNADRVAYIAAVKAHRPCVATVIDITSIDLLPEALAWAEDISQFVQSIIVVPKIPVIEQIPEKIRGANVILGYSVPTKYGGTAVPIESFYGRSIHLLGGSPHTQMWLYWKVAGNARIVSVDCNMHQFMATKYGNVWTGKRFGTRMWTPLRAISVVSNDVPAIAFELSCRNIMTVWRSI